MTSLVTFTGLYEALSNTFPASVLANDAEVQLPNGYSFFTNSAGDLFLDTWRGAVYRYMEFYIRPDGSFVDYPDATTQTRVVFANADGFTTPEFLLLDAKPMTSVGSMFDTISSAASSAVSSATSAISSAASGLMSGIGSALNGAMNAASNLLKGAMAGASSVFKTLAAKAKSFIAVVTDPAKLAGMLKGALKGALKGILGKSSVIVGGDTATGGASGGAGGDAGSNKLVRKKIEDGFMYFMRIASMQFPSDVILFNVSPTIDESGSASYDSIQPLHFPGAIQMFKTSNPRNFNVNVKLVSRNPVEATMNLAYINIIRSWVMPYYGEGTLNNPAVADKIGAPPDILMIDAYGEGNISGVTAVLMNYSWTYPDDIDYIPTQDGIPFPRILDISMTFSETHAPSEFEKFDLAKYRSGDYKGAYGRVPPKVEGALTGGLGGIGDSIMGSVKGAVMGEVANAGKGLMSDLKDSFMGGFNAATKAGTTAASTAAAATGQLTKVNTPRRKLGTDGE